MSESTTAFATRLPTDEADRLELAIEATDQTKSKFVRRAIRYYVTKNPDRIEALYPENELDQFLRDLMG